MKRSETPRTINRAAAPTAPFEPPFTGVIGRFTSFDGLELGTAHWQSASVSTQALVVAVHGLSGAARDFEPLGAHLAPLGFPVFAYDLRGQGNDPRPKRRGDLETPDHWHRDLSAFIGWLRQRPGCEEGPVVVFGESMGGFAALHWCARQTPAGQPAGLILSAPVVRLDARMKWWQTALFHLFRTVAPWKRFRFSDFDDSGTERKEASREKGAPSDPALAADSLQTEGEGAKLITRDADYAAWLETAPWMVDSYTIRFISHLVAMIQNCPEAAAEVKCPNLLLSAEHDVFIDPQAIASFARTLGADDVTIHHYPEAYHLLLHDHDSGRVLSDITMWLSERFPE